MPENIQIAISITTIIQRYRETTTLKLLRMVWSLYVGRLFKCIVIRINCFIVMDLILFIRAENVMNVLPVSRDCLTSARRERVGRIMPDCTAGKSMVLRSVVVHDPRKRTQILRT